MVLSDPKLQQGTVFIYTQDPKVDNNISLTDPLMLNKAVKAVN